MSSPAHSRPRQNLVALLRAAKDNPRDQATRLVLADWLEEQGNAVFQSEYLDDHLGLSCLGVKEHIHRSLIVEEFAVFKPNEDLTVFYSLANRETINGFKIKNVGRILQDRSYKF